MGKVMIFSGPPLMVTLPATLRTFGPCRIVPVMIPVLVNATFWLAEVVLGLKLPLAVGEMTAQLPPICCENCAQ